MERKPPLDTVKRPGALRGPWSVCSRVYAPVPKTMNPDFEHDAVMWLSDFAQNWAEAPILDFPALSAAMDQFAAGTLENMNLSEMTESERIAYGLGYMMCAKNLHAQIDSAGLHEDDVIGNVCEATGLFAGTVAAKALDPYGQ